MAETYATDAPMMMATRPGIESGLEYTIYMREDCHICRSEGFAAQTRVKVSHKGISIIATISHVMSDLVKHGQAGLSEQAWRKLHLQEGETVVVEHPKHLASMSRVRAKLYGELLKQADFDEILGDIVAGRLSDIELSAFVSGCTSNDLTDEERVNLTSSMVSVGGRLNWEAPLVLDKHCVGGLPGNRTTPLVVAIVASHGLAMPKTSSRAITSPAGTADTIETMTNVELDFEQIQQIVQTHGGCLAWGGAINLSPADDKLIRIERALDVDSDGQLVASVMSKKIAAGATHLVLDIPFGPTAKVRSREHADKMAASLLHVAKAFGIEARAILSNGSEPVGRGIGPALEAQDVLAVLRNESTAPQDLLHRAADLAGSLLEMSGTVETGRGIEASISAVHSGRAYQKFVDICKAQGGFSAPPVAPLQRAIYAPESKVITAIDNRRLAKLAKLLGAPYAKAAGIYLEKKLGDRCRTSEILMTLHAETQGELDYAQAYWSDNRDMVEFGEKS